MTPTISRRGLLAGAAGVAAAGTLGGLTLPTAEAATSRPVRYWTWDSAARLGAGTHQGTVIDAAGQLAFGQRQGLTSFTDPVTGVARSYEYATYTTAWTSIGFGATELIASWNATTAPGTWIEVAAEVAGASGQSYGTYVLARWTSGDSTLDIRRQTVKNQATTYATVKTDTLAMLGSARAARFRLRVRLHRRLGWRGGPRVRMLGAMCSAIPTASTGPHTSLRYAAGKVLPVPTYSQQLHRGHYPQWGGGGAAWCSATSTAMVLDYWKVGPSAAETAWVTLAGESRPQVDHSARNLYDYSYGGTGNWPFNTAYAGARGLRSFVTRLRTMNEAEQMVAAGIPVICDVVFSSSQLTGAGYSTNGHLLVVVGFTASGDVVVNDPASHLVASDAQVRTTYRRAEFENVWLGRTGGVAYIMAPWGKALPASTLGEPNWG